MSEKASYVVTIVVAGLAWTLTHIVDELLASPMLLYNIQDLDQGAKKSIYLTLRNVTRDKTFRKVRVIITAAPEDSLSDRAVIPVQPAWEGDQPGLRVGRTFDYTFSEIQPQWQFEITASYQSSSRPSLRLSVPDGTVYAVGPSLETWLVQYEFELLIGLVGFWIFSLIVLYWWPRRVPGGGDDS